MLIIATVLFSCKQQRHLPRWYKNFQELGEMKEIGYLSPMIKIDYYYHSNETVLLPVFCSTCNDFNLRTDFENTFFNHFNKIKQKYDLTLIKTEIDSTQLTTVHKHIKYLFDEKIEKWNKSEDTTGIFTYRRSLKTNKIDNSLIDTLLLTKAINKSDYLLIPYIKYIGH